MPLNNFILVEDARDDGVAVSADVFPAALNILDGVARKLGLGINQILRSLQGLDDASVQSTETVGPGSLGLSVESAAEFLSEDFHGDGTEFLIYQ